MAENKKVIDKKETKSVISSEVEKSVKTNKIPPKGTSFSEAAATSSKVSRNNKKATAKETGGLTVTTYSLLGKDAGTLDLPKEIFGAEVNTGLLSQALRVFQNNQKGHFGNTKTRGEVEGSTRKTYAQKGTGRARHGGIRAPIFVGGGIAMGPKARKDTMDLPQKMRRAALISALSLKTAESAISAISGIDKATGKTKEFVQLAARIMNQESSRKIKSIMIVGDNTMENAARAVKNITGVEFVTADNLNVFEVIKHNSIVLTKEAIEKLQKRLLGKEENSKHEARNKHKIRMFKI